MITLDDSHQFVTGDGKQLGVFVHAKTVKGRTRYLYRTGSGTPLASGMPPAQFVGEFWHRDDYVGPETL